MKMFLVLALGLLAVVPGNPVLGFGVYVDVGLGGGSSTCPTYADWIVIMQRTELSLSFDKTWEEYKDGFGDVSDGENSDFWMGNHIVHLLTNRFTYSLRVEVKTMGRWYYAVYDTFSLDSEEKKYAIHLSGYHGTAGDSLSNTTVGDRWNHNGMKFSTPDDDSDNSVDRHCSRQYRAGWWFNNCWYSCLTCEKGENFNWYTLNYLASKGALEMARMIIYRS